MLERKPIDFKYLSDPRLKNPYLSKTPPRTISQIDLGTGDNAEVRALLQAVSASVLVVSRQSIGSDMSTFAGGTMSDQPILGTELPYAFDGHDDLAIGLSAHSSTSPFDGGSVQYWYRVPRLYANMNRYTAWQSAYLASDYNADMWILRDHRPPSARVPAANAPRIRFIVQSKTGFYETSEAMWQTRWTAWLQYHPEMTFLEFDRRFVVAPASAAKPPSC